MLNSEVHPVFIIGSERSGTNLLRTRVSAAQNAYCGPNPTHFFKHLYFGLYKYGDLFNDQNFRALISDALALCYNHFAPWSVRITVDEVVDYMIESNAKREFFHITHSILSLYSKRVGAKSYILKDNNIFDYANLLKNKFPEARFIYLHRDPRDFVLSQLNRKLQFKSVFRLSKMWKLEQLKCIAVKGEYPDSVLRLGYEEYLKDESKSLEQILSFLEVDKGNSGFEATERFDSAGMDDWRNLQGPILKQNFQKFRTMPAWRNKIIEKIAKDEMIHLGYLPEYGKLRFFRFYIILDFTLAFLDLVFRRSFYTFFRSESVKKSLARKKFLKKYSTVR